MSGVRTELVAAAECGMQAVRAIARAIAAGQPTGAGWHQDNDLWHADRMARLAHYHACRARPDLRLPDSYDMAVAEHRARRKGPTAALGGPQAGAAPAGGLRASEPAARRREAK